MTGLFHLPLRKLASLRVTLTCICVAVAVALLGDSEGSWPVGVTIAIPFGILFLNLLAALAANVTLRTSPGLFGFHLALAALALLAAADRLTGLTGHVEVTEGVSFDPALVEAEVGPFHTWGLDRVRFRQGGFEIAYDPGMKRRGTVSTVYLPGDDGASYRMEVGDDTPLVIGHYRFYTSFNKGFAPLVTFTDSAGTAHSGVIHLPSYPLNYYKQGNEWSLPGTDKRVKVWLHLPDEVYVEEEAWRFRKPENAVLVVMADGARHEMQPGETLSLGSGHLRYDELRSWMGYTIAYNPVVPWMLAAAAVAILCLAWHVIGKIRAAPWDDQAQARLSQPGTDADMEGRPAYVR